MHQYHAIVQLETTTFMLMCSARAQQFPPTLWLCIIRTFRSRLTRERGGRTRCLARDRCPRVVRALHRATGKRGRQCHRLRKFPRARRHFGARNERTQGRQLGAARLEWTSLLATVEASFSVDRLLLPQRLLARSRSNRSSALENHLRNTASQDGMQRLRAPDAAAQSARCSAQRT